MTIASVRSCSAALLVFLGGLGAPGTSYAGSDDEADTAPGLGLDSETVHRIYGAAILATSTALIVEDADGFTLSELRYAPPGLTMVTGGLLMIDPLLHGSARPSGYGPETRQHLLLGGALLAAGSVDLAHEAEWLDHWSWGLVLPAGLLAGSASFLFHAQHGDPAQHDLLTAQHRLLGATLAVAAVTKGLAAVPAEDGDEPRWPQMQTAWIVAAGLAGIQLLLYSEGTVSDKGGHDGHSIEVGFTGRGLAVMGAF